MQDPDLVHPPREPGDVLPPGAGRDGATFLERRGITPAMFGTLCVLFFFMSYQVVGTGLTIAGLSLFGAEMSSISPGVFRSITGFAQVVLLLVPVFFLVRLTARDPAQYLRLRVPSPGVLLVPLAGIFSLQQMLQVYMVLQGRIPLPPGLEKLIEKLKPLFEEGYKSLLSAATPVEFLVVIVVVAVIPAVSEEFVFRGLIQRSYEKGLGPARGILATGIIFGAFHLNPFEIVPLVALGLYLGFLAYRSGSVWVSSTAHFFNNFVAVTAFNVGMGTDAVVTGDPNAMPFGMLMATFWFSAVIFLLSTYYFFHLTMDRARDSSPVL